MIIDRKLVLKRRENLIKRFKVSVNKSQNKSIKAPNFNIHKNTLKWYSTINGEGN